MPYKKSYRRKPRRKTYRRKPARMRLTRSINNPSIFNFKRTFFEQIQIGTPTTPSGTTPWTVSSDSLGFGRVFDFKLNQLNDATDFTNLFSYYKINAVGVKIWPSATHTQENSLVYANQLLMRWDNNWTQLSSGSTNQLNYMDSQTAKVRRVINSSGQPIKLYMKVRQAAEVMEGGNVVNTTSYALKRPAWISTAEDEVSHFGLNIMFQKVDGSAFAVGTGQKMRVEYTMYLSCKKVS